MSKELRVHREGEFDYQIILSESFSEIADKIKALEIAGNKICIVSDDCVAPLYADQVKENLAVLEKEVDLFTFPAGEGSKNLDTVKGLYSFLIERHYTRKDLLVALGGGVTGDLTGYTAGNVSAGY